MSALMLNVPAIAQQQPVEAQAEDEKLQSKSPQQPVKNGTVQLEKVVITAERRDSTVQKTPISITAVSGDDLREKGISNVTDLAREVPGVAAKSGGPGQTEFIIRGMSSAAGVAPTVGFYLDETPISPPTIATPGKVDIDPDLYDLARVEILRGPQGTLYGASSMGGTIKLITTPPSLVRREASIQVVGSSTQGGGANGTLNAMMNMPLVEDIVALRLVAMATHNSGWIDRVVVPNFPLPSNSDGVFFGTVRGDVANTSGAQVIKDVNSEDLQGARAALLIKPSANLTITPGVFYQRIKQSGPDAYDNPPATWRTTSHLTSPSPSATHFQSIA